MGRAVLLGPEPSGALGATEEGVVVVLKMLPSQTGKTGFVSVAAF